MSTVQGTSIRLRNDSLSLRMLVRGWLRRAIESVRDSRQAAPDERIAAELPDHLRYDVGALDCIPSQVSRWQVHGSYQEALEAQWRRGV